jgi:hypothetical protein
MRGAVASTPASTVGRHSQAADTTTKEWVKNRMLSRRCSRHEPNPKHRSLFQHYRPISEVSPIIDIRPTLRRAISAGRTASSDVGRGEAVARRSDPIGAEVYAEGDQAERSDQPDTAKQNDGLERTVLRSRFGNGRCRSDGNGGHDIPLLFPICSGVGGSYKPSIFTGDCRASLLICKNERAGGPGTCVRPADIERQNHLAHY